MAVEGMMALTTRRCMCRAMGVEDLMVDVIVEGMAAVASAAAAAMEEAVIVEEAAMVEVVEAAAMEVWELGVMRKMTPRGIPSHDISGRTAGRGPGRPDLAPAGPA